MNVEKRSPEETKKIIDEIAAVIKPIFAKYNVHKLGLFGAYALGLQSEISNVDIWCERGGVTNFNALMSVEKEIKEALGKPVNIQFSDADLSPYYLQDITATFVDLTDEEYK